jgi:S1-C subfamily serine protease
MPGVSLATGFVVDAEHGLILTNRHVVRPGPVTAEAVFLNHERVRVWPVYRDPVHDFGFFRYDPKSVRFMRPTQLALAPEAARVGAEIRVIGNDAGEKLSILAGTLARLDREAPSYGQGNYGDFNTFYYQAASSTSGGSSGSPVVDRRGRVIALNAGGRQSAASSFFLPLDRVVRALDLIRAGKPVTRGTIQAVFRYQSYDELRRLGLRGETEASAREAFPEAIGMLVVAETVPGGAAHDVLEPGDILLRVQGRRVDTFADLEAILDDSVGERVAIAVERGGALLEVLLTVQDLHAITPATYLELGGAILHPLSYQQARNHAVPVGGVYLASPGYSFGRAGVASPVVITEVEGEPVEDLDEFERLVSARADGARILLRYFPVFSPHTSALAAVTLDRRWFPRACDRTLGRSLACTAEDPRKPSPAAREHRHRRDGPVRHVLAPLVAVEFDVPRDRRSAGERLCGAGLVVDAEAAQVVDRDTVPVTIGDAHHLRRIGRGAGRVVLLHRITTWRSSPRSAADRDTPVESGAAARSLAAGTGVAGGRTRRQQVVSQSRGWRWTPPRFRCRSSALPRVERGAHPLTEAIPSVAACSRTAGEGARALGLLDHGPPAGRMHLRRPCGAGLDLVAPLRGQPFVWRSLGAELETMTLRERALGSTPRRAGGSRGMIPRRGGAARRLEAGARGRAARSAT